MASRVPSSSHHTTLPSLRTTLGPPSSQHRGQRARGKREETATFTL